MGWERYEGETVTGNVRVLRGELDRDLLAYLPTSHGLPRRRARTSTSSWSGCGRWWRTRSPVEPGRESLGALSSLHALYVHADVFGFAGLLSHGRVSLPAAAPALAG